MKKQLAGLSDEEQRALLAELLRKKTAKLKKKPLSFAQERLWFLYQLDPGNTAHNDCNIIRLYGRLDAQALERCFNQVVARHETLRTTFSMVKGEALQVIAPALELKLTLVNLEDIPQAEQKAKVTQLAVEQAQRPFDLATGPLVRTTLLRLNQTEHVLLVAMHHIISDAWSVGVLLQEMMTFYKLALLGDGSGALAELPLQYADFAAWQRDWLQGDVLENQRSYWRERLANLKVLELPTDHQRPEKPSNYGATYSWMFGEGLTTELKLLSQREGLSLFMVLLAGFMTILYRYSGQADVAVRSPIANRMRQELEGLIGYFANTLVLRVNLSQDMSFRELLEQVREMCRGAYAHQDLPFEKALEDMKLAQREAGRQSPLFPVMFILQNAPLPLPDVPGLGFEDFELDDGLAPFELTLALREVKGDLRGRLNYSTDLFAGGSMERMAEHFRRMMKTVAGNPDQRLSTLMEQIPVEQIPSERIRSRQMKEYEAPRTPVEETLAQVLANVLGVERVGIHDNFFELGGDSLLMLQVVTRARLAGLQFTPLQTMQNQTIAELAALLSSVPAQTAEQGIVSGALPFTIAHSSFFSRGFQNPHHWNVAWIFEVQHPLEPDLLAQALELVVAHHDGLRLRFPQDGINRHAHILPVDDSGSFSYFDFSDMPQDAHKQAIESLGNDLHYSLDLSDGPLLRVALIHLGDSLPQRLLIVIHHLLFDNVSLMILLDDFFSAHKSLSQQKSVLFPPKTTSIKQWAERLNDYTHSPALRQELDYWRSLPWDETPSLPLDYPENKDRNTATSADSIEIALDVDETNVLLSEAPKYQVEVRDILLMALLHALTKWSGGRTTVINEITSGRYAVPGADEIDLSRTVGWLSFTSYLMLEKKEADSPLDAVFKVKQQLLQIPNQGQGYQMLLYGSGDAEIVENLKPYAGYNILFNYVGHREKRRASTGAFQEGWDAGFIKPAQENGGMLQNPHQDPYNSRDSVLICPMSISKDQLVAQWVYSSNLHKRETIEGVAHDFKQELQRLITYMRTLKETRG